MKERMVLGAIIMVLLVGALLVNVSCSSGSSTTSSSGSTITLTGAGSSE